MSKVIIKEGPGAGQEFDLDKPVILGRLDTNDIPIRDGKASREHAKIYQQGDRFAIVDLNSVNGTFVNGMRITKQILEPGDEITIGVVSLLFEDPKSAERAKAAAGQRKSLDDAFETKHAPTAAASSAGSDIVMKSHKPIQYSRIKHGQPLVGFDLDQLSEGGRMIVYVLLIGVFALLIYVGYIAMA